MYASSITGTVTIYNMLLQNKCNITLTGLTKLYSNMKANTSCTSIDYLGQWENKNIR